jgi:DNA polymerase I
VPGVREAYLATLDALRRRELPTRDVSSLVRLTKSPERYLETREERRELPYEAMLAAGRRRWSTGERVRVYRTRTSAGVVEEPDEDEDAVAGEDPRDYDVGHYARVLREIFAARLERAFTPEDFAAVFADPGQLSLFAPAIESVRPVLSKV